MKRAIAIDKLPEPAVEPEPVAEGPTDPGILRTTLPFNGPFDVRVHSPYAVGGVGTGNYTVTPATTTGGSTWRDLRVTNGTNSTIWGL